MKSNNAMNLNAAVIAGIFAIVISNYREPYSYISVILLLIAAICLQKYLKDSRLNQAEKEKKEAERQEEILLELRNMEALAKNELGHILEQLLIEKEHAASYDRNIEMLSQKLDEYGQHLHKGFEQENASLERMITGIDQQRKSLDELPQCIGESIDEMQELLKNHMEDNQKDRQQFLDQLEDTAIGTAKRVERSIENLIDDTNEYEENLYHAMQQLSDEYQQFEKLAGQIMEQMSAMSADDLNILKQYFDTAEEKQKGKQK